MIDKAKPVYLAFRLGLGIEKMKLLQGLDARFAFRIERLRNPLPCRFPVCASPMNALSARGHQ